MRFPERLTGGKKRESYFQKTFLWMGLSVTDAGLLCVSESWARSDVVIPEIAKEIWNSNRSDRSRERERKGQRQAGRNGREGGGGGQETDDQASLSTPSSPSSLLTALFAFLSSSPHLSSLSLPPLLWGSDCFPVWLAIGWLAVCHHNQHSETILRTFYPNPVVPPGVPWRRGEEVKRVWGGRQTKYCWLSGVRPEPSSLSHMPSTFFLPSQWEFLCLELFLSPKSWS